MYWYYEKKNNKELTMTKKDHEDFENSSKYWSYSQIYVQGDVKVRDHCHITGRYNRSAHKYCNINVKVNHSIPIVFHSLKNYDSHLTINEPGKLSFKINAIPNGLEKYMSLNINNKLNFMDAIQFLSSSFDGLIKNLPKDDFNYFSQEFNNNVLDLVKQK